MTDTDPECSIKGLTNGIQVVMNWFRVKGLFRAWGLGLFKDKELGQGVIN